MFESILHPKKAIKNPLFAYFFGILAVLLGYGSALVVMPDEISFVTIFFATFALMPLLMVLLRVEEKKERKHQGNFMRRHKNILLVYGLLFLGLFTGFLLLGFLLQGQDAQQKVFSFQQDYLSKTKGISKESLETFFTTLPPISVEQALGIFTKNLSVLLIALVLSFLYGLSSIFILALNSSVFAYFIIQITSLLQANLVQGSKIASIFFIHFFPEMLGFLLAAFAGGVISQAVMVEKKGSQEFKNVIQDALKLFLLAVLLLVIAAFLETYVTTALFYRVV